MNVERIKRMAVNAGAFSNEYFSEGHVEFDDDCLARFARAVAEECAKASENYDLGTPEGHAIAAAIRNLYREQA